MSTKIFAAAALWVALLNAQAPEQNISVTGEIQSSETYSTMQLAGFYVELYSPQNHSVTERVLTGSDGRFQFYNATPGWYTVGVLAAPGDDPIVEAYKEIVPGNAQIVLQLPSRSADKAPSGVVSLRDLQHPVKKQAVRCVAEAQRYAQKNETAKAVVKLEEAVRIDPEYRDAHTNLGAEYARAGRIEEARQHFLRALEIGPPDVIIYSNLSWSCLALRQFSEAEEFGRRAVALDASNAKAHLVLGNVLAMEAGKATEAIRQLQIAAPDEPKALILIELLRAKR